MDSKEVAYLLMQHKYLTQMLGKDNYTEEEVMVQSHKLFPADWAFLDDDYKIKIIAKAIKEKRNLIEIYDRETEVNNLPPRLDTK